MKLILVCFTLSIAFCSYSSDSSYIKIHFLYGSKPKKEFKATEGKWFGGLHGGHVGIEYDTNKIIDFVPSGKFHYVEKHNNRHSSFTEHDTTSFWEIFGSHTDSMKKMTIIIPIASHQKKKLDSLVKAYFKETPYDYAFVGMRCAAASYDILAQIGVTKKYSRRRTYRKNFYPKRTRKKLVRLAKRNNWRIIKKEGSLRRKWERK